MGLFRRKVSDREWKAAVSTTIGTIQEVCDVFETTAEAIAADPLAGWLAVREPLSSLAALEVHFKAAKAICDGAGSPVTQGDSVTARAVSGLDSFFSAGHLAFHWGKYHYRDASGAPGERTFSSSGIARRAAVTRVTNNGTRYASNALSAARAGRAVLAALSEADRAEPAAMQSERAKPMNEAPKFAALLAAHHLDAYLEKRLLGGKFIKLSRLLTLGGFLFENGAVLGRAYRDRFDSFLVPFAVQGGRPEAVNFALIQGRSVAELAPTAKTITELFMIHEMRKSDPSLRPEAWAQWLLGSAEHSLKPDLALQSGILFGLQGAGFGAQFPDRFAELYEGSYANVDAELWSRAHKEGVDIPEEPDQFVPLDEREHEAVADFAEFCKNAYPDYASALGIESAG